MFRFESPQYLWLLWLVVVLVAVRYYSLWRRQKKITRIGDKDLVRQLMPDASTMRRRVKFWLTMAAVAVLVVVIARPQMGSKISNEKRNGIETIICLDISNSMLAQDVAPSRLDKSKMLVENLVDNFSNDKIGLVVFAGDAFVQLPITSDYVSAKMFLQGISPALISTQGTDIARAISVASSSFTQQQGVGKAIIVITDGEDHEGGALDAAKEARKKGINVFILGIGSTKGSPIPVGGGEYIRDNAGNIVMSALNEDMCRDIARAGSIYPCRQHQRRSGEVERRAFEAPERRDRERYLQRVCRAVPVVLHRVARSADSGGVHHGEEESVVQTFQTIQEINDIQHEEVFSSFNLDDSGIGRLCADRPPAHTLRQPLVQAGQLCEG
jgi:Ca-activated chloride channel family protein